MVAGVEAGRPCPVSSVTADNSLVGMDEARGGLPTFNSPLGSETSRGISLETAESADELIRRLRHLDSMLNTMQSEEFSTVV
jgi:hypothetical protein